MIHYAYQMCTALAEAGAEVTLVTARQYELDAFTHNFKVERRLNLWLPVDPSASELPRGTLAKIWRKIRRTARRGVRAVRFVREWLALSSYLLRQRPDLVQFGSIQFAFEAWFLARLRRRGLRLTQICHEYELRERGSGPLVEMANRLYAGVYQNFEAIFLHGESNRQRFLSLFGVPPERTHVIPLGNESMFLAHSVGVEGDPDLRACYGLPPDEPVVLFFGNLTVSKGIPDLIDAFAEVRKRIRARLVIAGYPTKYIDMDKLFHQVADLGISDAVTFDARYIPIEEVGPLFRLATVVVYPYLSSTQSASLQVAYAFERPVVATQVGGLPEEVEDGKSGYLVPPHAPDQLAQAILKIIEDPQRAAEMGVYARQLSETRYSWESIAGKIMSVYRDLMSREARPH
jgi:glycosyltransferase involved in cell wall biosynthesis